MQGGQLAAASGLIVSVGPDRPALDTAADRHALLQVTKRYRNLRRSVDLVLTEAHR